MGAVMNTCNVWQRRQTGRCSVRQPAHRIMNTASASGRALCRCVSAGARAHDDKDGEAATAAQRSCQLHCQCAWTEVRAGEGANHAPKRHRDHRLCGSAQVGDVVDEVYRRRVRNAHILGMVVPPATCTRITRLHANAQPARNTKAQKLIACATRDARFAVHDVGDDDEEERQRAQELCRRAAQAWKSCTSSGTCARKESIADKRTSKDCAHEQKRLAQVAQRQVHAQIHALHVVAAPYLHVNRPRLQHVACVGAQRPTFVADDNTRAAGTCITCRTRG
jgi:hypothetical protein